MDTQNAPVKQTRIKRICRNPVFIVLAMIVSFVASIYAIPPVFSAGWHATHSSVQRYGKYRIRVPWPYVLFRHEKSAWLIKMRFVPDRQLYKFAAITVTPRSERFDINLWKKQVVQAFQQHGVNVSGSFDASMGSIPVACIEQTVNKAEFKYFVMCHGEDGSRIEYMGDGNGLRQFKSILGGITPVGK